MVASSRGSRAAWCRLLSQGQLAVVVAVIAVGMVQVTVDQVVDVIAVWHWLVATPGSVFVLEPMLDGSALRRAAVRMLLIDGDSMLVDMIIVRVVQVPVVEIVGVSIVADGEMAAARSVLVIVVWVDGVIALCHRLSSARVALRITLVPSTVSA